MHAEHFSNQPLMLIRVSGSVQVTGVPPNLFYPLFKKVVLKGRCSGSFCSAYLISDAILSVLYLGMESELWMHKTSLLY